MTYKGMSVEASCRKYLDALAQKLFALYDFQIAYKKHPTMGDVLRAKDGQQGQNGSWEFRMNRGKQLTEVTLPTVFTAAEWNLLSSLNSDTTNRIHDGTLPMTSNQKPFVIIPHSKFTNDYVNSLKRIAVIADIVFDEDRLLVKDESELSESSGSESNSPDKEKKL